MSLFIFVAFVANLDNADGLKVLTEYSQYEIGDFININITNPTNSISVFNYEITNDQKMVFPEQCTTVDDTTDLESGENRMIVVDTECAGPDYVGIWTVSSRLTGDDGLMDLSNSAVFEIVNKIFLCGLDDCSESKDFLDRNNIPLHFQNNTGWNQEKFKRSALYLFSDNFGKIVVPITTDGNYDLEIKTEKRSPLDIVEASEGLYMYVSPINKNDPIYSKIFKVSSFYFSPEKKNMINLSFPDMFDLDNFSPNLKNSESEIVYKTEHDGVVISGYVLPDFGNFKMFTHDLFFLKQLESSSISDETHIHVTIPQIRPHNLIISSFNGTFFNENKDDAGFTYYDYVFPPLKQTQNGVESQNILCKEHLELILQPSSSPACVKPESIPKLIERGWIT